METVEMPTTEDSLKSIIGKTDLLYPFVAVLIIRVFFHLSANFSAIALIISLNLGIINITPENESLYLILINLSINLIAQLGSILAFILLYRSNRLESDEKRVPGGQFLFLVLLVFSIEICFIIFVVPVVDIFLEPLGETIVTYELILPSDIVLENPLYYVLYFGVLVFGAAISEELIFRRAMIPFLERRGLGSFWVLTISGLVFSLIHTPSDLVVGSIRYAVVHFFGTFAGGLSLGFVYMRTRDVRWSILLHGIINGFASVSSLALARYEAYGELTLLMMSSLWILASIIVGIAASIYAVIEFTRKRRTLELPAWIQILTDFNFRTERLRPIIVFSIGFILIEGGIPVLFNFIYEFLGEPSRERLLFENLIEITYWLVIIVISLYFVFRIAKPLESPEWVSPMSITTLKPFVRREFDVLQVAPEETLFCTNCGKQKVPNSRFCVFCGNEYLVYGSESIQEQE
jgi:membrane protease YdiL (CAAX protease family)